MKCEKCSVETNAVMPRKTGIEMLWCPYCMDIKLPQFKKVPVLHEKGAGMKCEKCDIETEGVVSKKTGIRIPWCRDCMGVKPSTKCACGRPMCKKSKECRHCAKLYWARTSVARLKECLAEAENQLKALEAKVVETVAQQKA